MLTQYRWYLTAIFLLTLVLTPSGLASAQSPAPEIPDGFYLIREAPGITMYQKDYQGGSPDYVQLIDLSQGAQIVAMHGEVKEERAGKGAYGGNDARILSQSLNKYWNQLTSINPDAFCVTNGQFFYMKESPTRLPFPLKVNGEIISDGYGINEFPDQKLILELWEDRAFISSLSQESLYYSDAPNIIAGLSQTASKRIDRYVGRTFVGIDDRNVDGNYETVMIFNSSLARQVDAAGILESFGADRVMMLDGGGSTQISCQGKSYIYSERLIPQAIGVIAAPAGSTETPPPPAFDPAEGDKLLEAQAQASGNTTESANDPSIQATDSPQQSDPQPAPQDEAAQPVTLATPIEPLPINLQDVLFVPLMMSPVLAFLLFIVGKIRLGAP